VRRTATQIQHYRRQVSTYAYIIRGDMVLLRSWGQMSEYKSKRTCAFGDKINNDCCESTNALSGASKYTYTIGDK